MNTTRFTKLMLSALLVIAVLIAFQVFQSPATPAASIPAYTGRGDYQRYESQFFQPYTGRGDYQRYENQFFSPNTGATESSRSYVGMGDLHRFEAQQEIEYAGKIPITP